MNDDKKDHDRENGREKGDEAANSDMMMIMTRDENQTGNDDKFRCNEI